MEKNEVTGLVDGVHALYCRRSSLDDFATLYAADAVFSDPLVRKAQSPAAKKPFSCPDGTAIGT
jgi:hypothetical protein